MFAQTWVSSPSVLAPFENPACFRRRAGIKRPVLADLQRRQSWTGRSARSRDGLARFTFTTVSGFFLSELPAGFPKGISSDHHRFVETRKGAPTSWAGTPDALHLEPWTHFAKPFFTKIPAKNAGFKEGSVTTAARKQRCRLNFDAGAHGGGDRHPVDVVAFGARRLCLLHGIGKRLDVLDQLVLRE
jgi:hypothetical protein